MWGIFKNACLVTVKGILPDAGPSLDLSICEEHIEDILSFLSGFRVLRG